MAEFASGAVHSLLSVLHDEALLLGRVEGDMKFIQEEMESMNSFLHHLARTKAPGRDHEEQVRTWMKQVRDLAYDCSNCIDLYLLRGDRAVYRTTGPVGRYLWWVPWYLQKLYAQHRAAIQLRELKDRARDVGKRRQRYDVKIPEKSGKKDTTTTLAPITGAASSSQATGKGDTGEEDDDDDSRARLDSDDRRALAFSEPRILEECTHELLNWLRYIERIALWIDKEGIFPSIAIAAPDEEDGADVAREALAHPSVATKLEHKLWITFKWFWTATPRRILEEILKEIGRQAVRTRGDVKIPEKSGDKLSGPEATSSSSQSAGGGDEGTIPSDDEQVLGGLLPEPGEGERAPETEEEELDRKIDVIVKKTEEHLPAFGTERSSRVVPLEPLDILCDILQEPVQSVGKDQIEEKINETAMKIKKYLEKLDTRRSWIGLDHSEYVGILRGLLPRPKEDKPVKEATDISVDDQIAKNIREITNKIKVDILRELLPKPQEDKSVKEDMNRSEAAAEKIIVNMLPLKLLPKPKEDMDKLDEDQKIKEIIENIERILENIKENLLVKEIAKKIKENIEGKRTIIVLDGIEHVERWEVTKWELSQLGCAAGSAVIVTTDYTKGASQYCNPTRKPIEYSLVGFYHDKAIRLTSPFVNEDYYNYNACILHAILKNCEPHELCMKLFVRALHVNPKRSKEELEKLRDTLAFSGPLETNAGKTIKFSYIDLPRDYKTCFLYLAIFPQGDKIKRSTLVGRWLAEGLVTEEDWTHSVHRAERCFDELVDRGLVYPGDIGAAGKVKSCIVHNIAHEFITKIAKKEHFVDTRLAHHLARHFSVLSDVRLRSSDSIEKFLQKLYRIPQLPLVKVLDLEGCQCFEKNQHYIKNIFKKNQDYLKNICNKMLLLKYLSLRNTDITKLPKEINNLHQLEVLDIRQTKVHAHATKDVLLLKLKRLLAGHIDLIPISPDTGIVRAQESFSSVQIPGRIEKMTNMEVLSHVKASPAGHELEDIGKLWQLRKLGVVIKDKNDHLWNLLRVISDLHECLKSLSIRIEPGPPSHSNTDISFDKRPKLLESLSISGITTSGQLLPLLAKSRDQLTKVTLHNTLLNQNDLKDLAKLPKLRCVRFRHKSYIASKLTFNKDEFQNLKNLLVEGSNMTEINFEDEAGPELEKIVLSSTNITGITFKNGAAPNLEEIVLSSTNVTSITFENGATPNLKRIIFGDTAAPQPEKILSSTITGITFKNGATPRLEEIVLSFTNITSITFENGATPNLKKIVLSSININSITFGNGAAPKLEEIALSSTSITSVTFPNGTTPNLKKIVLSFTNMEFLSGINMLGLKELELNGSGITSASLLSLFTNGNQIAKVTLRDTLLKQGELQILAKQPNLSSLMLLDKSCDESHLTFSKEEFQNLKLLVVECFGITKISFTEGAAPKLKKIVWSFTDIQSLSGIDNLLALKELEFKGDKIPNQVREAIAQHPKYPVLIHTKQKNQDKEEEAQQQWALDSN